MEGGHLLITVSEATPRGPATTWDLTAAGDTLSGVEKRGENAGPQIAGVRAPAMKRPMPKAWTTPEPIFNGKDLTGWEPIGNAQNNKWIARNRNLVNDNPEVEGQRGPGAANIKTTRKFNDFKLHIEVNCPEHGNSGIYLRGRYEVQVGTEGGTVPSHEMGAVYGHFAPAGNIGNKLGQWTSFDITLVGRMLTVVRDGVKIHDNVELPGPTGGALDSNELRLVPSSCRAIITESSSTGILRFPNRRSRLPKKDRPERPVLPVRTCSRGTDCRPRGGTELPGS
jgi:hypothetical protein